MTKETDDKVVRIIVGLFLLCLAWILYQDVLNDDKNKTNELDEIIDTLEYHRESEAYEARKERYDKYGLEINYDD